MSRHRGSSGETAEEFLARLSRDPKFVEQSAVREAEHEMRARALALEEQPIVADLRKAGLDVTSVWDLVRTRNPDPAAAPVLLDHLGRADYSDAVRESLGRALAVGKQIEYWDTLVSLFRRARGERERDGIAIALISWAGPGQILELSELVQQSDLGEARIFFIRPIFVHGGVAGQRLVKSLSSDPELGKEARAVLRGDPQAN